MKLEIVEYEPPDHPWNEELTVGEWCEICGQTQITHDGNLDRVFDWMEAAGRKADEMWWYYA